MAQTDSGTSWVQQNKKSLPAKPQPKMTSDSRFQKFIADKSREKIYATRTTKAPAPTNWFENFRRGERGESQAAPAPAKKSSWLDLYITKRNERNRPAPSNPFGEPQGRTPAVLDRAMPKITPEIRAMAAVNPAFLDTEIVTPEYIKGIAHQDNDLAKRLANNYLDDYSRKMIGGYPIEQLDNATIDDLSNIGQRTKTEDVFKGIGGIITGGLKLIQDATRAPTKAYGYGVLSTGFEHQPKTIDPTRVKLSELDTLGVANVDLDKLPPYYSGQLKSGLSQNYAQQIERSVKQYHPDWLGPGAQPDPDPEKDKIYQGIVDKVFKERQDWDYYAKFFTPADISNTFFSTPGIRQAQAQGKPLTKEQESNILGTSRVAGLTASSRRVQFAKAMKDAGVTIDDEDIYGYANGWSADTVNKYAELLREKGVSLPELVIRNATWPELKRALDLMRWPAEQQADIARSLGYKVTDEQDKPVYVETDNGMGAVQRVEKSREFVFNVSNPDMPVSLDDIRTKADVAMIDRGQFADLLAMKYTYAALADVKTVPFQDLAADLTLDPTNFGKLQLIWAPLGEVFKLAGKGAKFVGKGMYYSGALAGDVGVGSLKTIGNLIGKAKGLEKEIIKPEDWRIVTDAAHFLTQESAQSVVNKITNRAHFVTKSLMPARYTANGDAVMEWVDDVLPRMQEAAQTGDWSAFAREVPVGAGDYAMSGLNAVSRDLKQIAGDEDAWGRFADNMSKLFTDEIGADDVKYLRGLAEKGDYAGSMAWLANKKIAHAIYQNIDPGDARRMMDASDLINHATSAYRSGMNVLTEKSMGIFDKTVHPTAQKINEVLSTFSRFWTNAVLTVRPGWNVINAVDNNARLMANGFNPSASVMAQEKKLIDLGMTPVQMREIIYGGNFMDEAVRLNVPVTAEIVDAAKFAGRLTVDSEPKQIENLVELSRRAAASLEDIPLEARKPMEGAVGQLRVEADKLLKGKGDIKSVRAAAAKVDNLANQMFGKTAIIDTPLFRSNLDKMKEYLNILKSGDGVSIGRIWNNFVGVGHAIHKNIESEARMRVFAPAFIEKYHEALKALSRDLPTFPDEARLAERFANIVDPQVRDEAVREASYAYADVQQRLRGLISEGALHPNKIPEIQDYLNELRSNPLSAARNFIYGTQPVVDGMTPAADILMQNIGDAMTGIFDGMSLADLSDPAKVQAAADAAYKRAGYLIRSRDAEANLAARTNEIMKPSARVPDAAVNWLQDQQITSLSDIDTTVRRMEKIASDIEGVNQELRDSFVELNHEPYLDTLDQIQRQLPGRAHRYDLMRDSFAEKFSGEARYGSEQVQLVGATMEKDKGILVRLSDGRTVPVDAIQIDDAQRAWYFDRYKRWEKAKPGGTNILTRSGIGAETGTGAKFRKPAYMVTGEPGMIPPDVAKSYTRKMEEDVVAHGGTIPTEYVDKDGVKHALAYDSPEDFINRFASGSGLGYYKTQGQGKNLIEGIQRTADNWTYLARVSDAKSMDELADVYINGRRVTDLYPADADVTKVKARIFSEKSAKVSVRYERNGMQVPPLTNDPSRGETLTDVTRRLWKDKIEGVYIETRGQWVPVFNPNAKAGERISFQKLSQDNPLSDLRVPVDTGTAIPDEMGEAMLKAQDAAAPVAEVGRDVESALTRLDNLMRAAPERPPFKADAVFDGKPVMTTGKMSRLDDGRRGIEVIYADGGNDLVPVSEIAFNPPEKPAVTAADQSLEQVYAELGMKTPEQVATIQALDPVSEFIKRHPRVNTRADLLDRVAMLREHGVPVADEQITAMADLLEAASVHMFHQEPDFLLKHVNLTAFAPDEGLYQRINLDTPEFKKFFGGSVATGDAAVSDVAKQSARAGEPMTLYHGTPTPGFTAFDEAMFGKTAPDIPGIYMTENPTVASGVAKEQFAGDANSVIGKGDAFMGIFNDFKMAADDVRQFNREAAKTIERLSISFSEDDTFAKLIDNVNKSDLTRKYKDDLIKYVMWRVPEENTQVISRSGYAMRSAKNIGGAYPLYASIKNPLDLDKVYDGKELNKIVNRIAKITGKSKDEINNYLPRMYSQEPVGRGVFDRIVAEMEDSINDTQMAIEKGIKPAHDLDGQRAALREFISIASPESTADDLYSISLEGSPDFESIINSNLPFDQGGRAKGAEIYQAIFMNSDLDHMASRDVLKKLGFDGATGIDGVPNPGPAQDAPHRVFIAFEPGQVKSAIANKGTWDIQNPNMLFEQGPQGEVLGAFKMIFDKQNGPFGMIHFGPGATTETVAHEFSHFIQGMAELPEQLFEGPEMRELRKQIRSQLDVVLEATGAPRLEYAGERGPKKYRYVSFQNLYKVDREASGLVDDVKWEKFVEQARQSNERFAQHFTAYLATGKAPTKKLDGVFKKLKEWLVEMFQARRASGERIPVEVKRIFDEWLTENPDWKRQLTKKGKGFLLPENQAVFEQAAKATGTLGDWQRAVDNLKVAYGGWNDSPAIDEFDRAAREAFDKLNAKVSTAVAPEQKLGESFLDTPEGERLGEILDSIDRIDAGKYRPKDTRTPAQITAELLGEVTPTKEKKFGKEALVKMRADLVDEARKMGVVIDDEAKAVPAIEKYFDDVMSQESEVGAAAGEEAVVSIMEPVWNAYEALLQDGKFHPKKLVGGEWVYPEGGDPMTVLGKMHAGKPTPPLPQDVGHLNSIDEILAKEKGTPFSLDELAALNAPNSTFVSPELVEVMKYHAGTKAYLDQWYGEMTKAIQGGFLPGKTIRGLSPEDIDLTQKWLNDKYSQLSGMMSRAQQAAEDKTKLVMMDFETTYNIDNLMQQGPALPSWAGPLAGVKPLRVGGIVPFFKFPRENIESWVNTLGNHPALFHNVARYMEEGNVERKRFGLSEQTLPVWPVQVGDRVMSVSPFAFISLGQMIRPFNPYIDEDATNVDQAIGVAGQMGFSLGPTMRLALQALGLSKEVMPIVPQAQALIAPQNYKYVAEPLQWALGLKTMRDEFYVNRQIVFDGLADLDAATTEASKQQILQDMANAIQSPDHPRRIAATDHYYQMRFDTSNSGYWTGLYSRETSRGELDLKQYKGDLAQLRAAMVAAGLGPDQVDLIEGYMQGDPRAEANRRLNALYSADKNKAISNTDTEAWANDVEVAGKRSEYYEQRALIEAEFQQKYGFSGTPMSEADRADYDSRIVALNKKYEDVLTQKNMARKPWQTDEDYQRGLSGMWLQYLNDTRPQFTQYKTYAEYQKAVDQWEKNLPKISRSLWSMINAPLSAVTTRNISELPGYLDAVSNKQAMDKFRSKYDTVSEAIYSTLRDRYYSGYWDAVTDKIGARRKLAEMEYNLKHPVPDEKAIKAWLAGGLYAGRFTDQDISRELKAHTVADIRNSILSGKDLPHRQALEISDLLSNIPPGKAYFAFLDTLPDDVRKLFDAYQVDSYTPLESPTKWSKLYEYIIPAIKGKFPDPSITDVRQWVLAVDENDAMTALRDRKFPGIKAVLDEYNAIDRVNTADRKAFRQKHPEIGLYYDWLYTDWQNSHPTWQKYYGSDTTSAVKSTGATARPTKTSYVKGPVRRYSTGGARRYGGGSYYYSSTTAQSKAAADAWNNFRSMAGPSLYDSLLSHWNEQTTLTADEMNLLQSLYKQYGFGAKDFNDWLENVLPAMRVAMMPGESIFDRTPYYSNSRQPQYRTGYSWFGRGKNAA